MASLTADVKRYKKTPNMGYKLGTTAGPGTFYEGAFITWDKTSGLAKPAGGPDEPVAGVYEGRQLTVAAGATANITVSRKTVVEVKTTSAMSAQGKVGDKVQLTNDNDIADHAGANEVFGRIVDVDSANNYAYVEMSD